MELPPDFKELLERFNARGVEYLIVGAYALAIHGAPRNTGDLDLLVKPVPENALRSCIDARLQRNCQDGTTEEALRIVEVGVQ